MALTPDIRKELRELSPAKEITDYSYFLRKVGSGDFDRLDARGRLVRLIDVVKPRLYR